MNVVLHLGIQNRYFQKETTDVGYFQVDSAVMNLHLK